MADAIPTTDYTVRMFAPEQWGQIDRFSKFFESSFPNAGRMEKKWVSGAGNHLAKALVLRHLSERMRPNLYIDDDQLQRQGYTPADNGRELAAVIENVFLELYSALDCSRKVTQARFQPKHAGKDSTRGFFQRAREGRFDDQLPSAVVAAFKGASWYDDLRIMRDELTHADIGSVHLDRQTGVISYMHTGLNRSGGAMVVEDIFRRVDTNIAEVNAFLGIVFQALCSLLKDVPTIAVCGMAKGRMLLREIRPEPTITFDSGVCRSLPWIEVDGEATCPLLCGAYTTAKLMQTQALKCEI